MISWFEVSDGLHSVYTPREARFATKSEIVSILKNAREKREEEERRRRWAEFFSYNFCQPFKKLVQIGEKATAERSEQGPCAKLYLSSLFCLFQYCPRALITQFKVLLVGLYKDQETPLKRLRAPNNVVRDVVPIVWDYLTWRWQVGLKHCLCFVSFKIT